jgi:hypothetical protein
VSRFSDFIRNASVDEKAEVYGRVMDRACERQIHAHECKRPNIAIMDYQKGQRESDLVPMVNRMCLTCGRHWFGPESDVKLYTRAEWDAWVIGAGLD